MGQCGFFMLCLQCRLEHHTFQVVVQVSSYVLYCILLSLSHFDYTSCSFYNWLWITPVWEPTSNQISESGKLFSHILKCKKCCFYECMYTWYPTFLWLMVLRYATPSYLNSEQRFKIVVSQNFATSTRLFYREHQGKWLKDWRRENTHTDVIRTF